jgi:hypothetical protein
MHGEISAKIMKERLILVVTPVKSIKRGDLKRVLCSL